MANVLLAVPTLTDAFVEIEGVKYPVSSGRVSVPRKYLNGLLDDGYEVVGAYGGAWEFNETGSDIVMASQDQFYQWITGRAGSVVGAPLVTWDDTAKQLVIGTGGAGVYKVDFTYAGQLSNTADIEACIHRNGEAVQNIRADQNVAAQATYQAGHVSGLLSLAAADTVDARFSSSTNTRTLNVRHANLTIVRVSP